ncbi:triacylglycerol lipase [Necator americanus]|uniref:Triacylglycerol lipase n=1 Tax=Necator americanus TaxID=51031 RepID=W2SI73_NECAM|nr:triacylglycerol lipase [Necator americanus]ETN68457.1 triacylglycerol lipase [Necator americanus]
MYGHQVAIIINGYQNYDFVRADYGTQGSYGGKTENSSTYFLDKGFTQAELYATSWGDTNTMNAAKRTHNCNDLSRLRSFVQAVLAYTGAPKVSLITHSMGVTLGRKLIKGGQNGFWPGDTCGLNTYTCGANPLPFPCNGPTYSNLLMAMNMDNVREASIVFSAWSKGEPFSFYQIEFIGNSPHFPLNKIAADDLILFGDQVWGRPTSLIPTSSGKISIAQGLSLSLVTALLPL